MYENEHFLYEIGQLVKMQITKAIPKDSETLTQLTIASKSHWNYSEKQITSWLPDLSISENYIATNQVYKLVENEVVLGYYSFLISDAEIELDNLFVMPIYIGKGYGKKLMLDFLKRIQEINVKKIVLYADPNVEAFYKHDGFKTIGKKATKETNRFLPIMEKENIS